jgi:hypothetical protein
MAFLTGISQVMAGEDAVMEMNKSTQREPASEQMIFRNFF